MTNDDVTDLYERASVGAKVIVAAAEGPLTRRTARLRLSFAAVGALSSRR